MASECKRCGVAFDVGWSVCRETDCGEAQVAPPKRKEAKTYKQRPTDRVQSRLSSIRRRASRRNFACTLTYADIAALIEQSCIYCGSTERIQIDRKNNNLGYTPENTAAACRRCNTVKNNVIEFDELLFIATHLGWRK
jgi:5-methylcytosine-specific restriction endonuclease McrA